MRLEPSRLTGHQVPRHSSGSRLATRQQYPMANIRMMLYFGGSIRLLFVANALVYERSRIAQDVFADTRAIDGA